MMEGWAKGQGQLFERGKKKSNLLIQLFCLESKYLPENLKIWTRRVKWRLIIRVSNLDRKLQLYIEAKN